MYLKERSSLFGATGEKRDVKYESPRPKRQRGGNGRGVVRKQAPRVYRSRDVA